MRGENKFTIRNDCGTLDVKVGEQFELKGRIPLLNDYFEGKLFLPRKAFKVRKKIESSGELPERTYSIEALVEGSYNIRYRIRNRLFKAVYSVDKYKVNVLK